MSSPRREFLSGVKALLTILLGVVPFGMISGIAVAATRIPPASGFVMSLLVFSGAALIVAVQQINTGAPALVVLFSGLVINLRFMIYSASLAPLFVGYRPPESLQRICSAICLRGIITHDRQRSPAGSVAALPGAGLTMLGWQLSVGIGDVGARRRQLTLDFIHRRSLRWRRLRSGTVYSCRSDRAGVRCPGAAPFQMGLVIAALLGILFGTLWEWRSA
jgi:hypothetical protein